MISLPFGDPDNEKPNVYSLFVHEILVGVALATLATPSVTDSTKSSTVRSPLPPPVLNAFSLNVTLTDELSVANSVLVISGPLLSFRFAVAFF